MTHGGWLCHHPLVFEKFSKIHMIWLTWKFKLSFRSFSSQSTIIMLLFSRTGLARQTFWPPMFRVQRSINSHGKWPYWGRKQNFFWWLRPHWYKNISHSNSTCWSICSIPIINDLVTSIMWAKSVTKERFEIDFIKYCSDMQFSDGPVTEKIPNRKFSFS